MPPPPRSCARAFSAAETVESAYGMATLARDGKAASIPILAPQQLVDCAPNPKHCGGTGGCEGSTQPLAFDYLVMAKGHDSEADYPYKGRDGTCEDSKHAPKIGITGKVELPTNNYTSLMHALVTAGPIAISVDASWGAYEGGVFSDPKAGIHTNIDHAVQLVGYGSMSGKDYWLVRNSWGASWGEQGYIKIERFGEGKEPCGTDTRPGDGFGCEGGPSTIQVCGTSGILSGSSYPTGAHLL
jgi:cathepsin L